MPSSRRRSFLASFGPLRSVAATVAAALVVASQVAAAAEPPYPESTAVPGISFRWDTHRQLAPGSDNWPLTWSADGNQYTSFGDGGGFGGNEAAGRVSLGFARIEGSADDYRGVNVWGGVRTKAAATFNGKSRGLLAIGTDLYMWRCGAGSTTANFEFQQLYRSTDGAQTWRPANWLFPGSLTFFCPAFLQFGQGYAGARDGYVYMYASERNNREWIAHVPGRVTLMRAPKDRLMDRAAYEFFAGRDAGGAPRWSANVAERAPVFEDPNGGRLPAVAYNPGLRRYFMVIEHAPKGQGNLGVFDAPEPWGPWTTVLYEEGWGRGRVETSTFYANFSPKWWSDGGKGFVLAFTGGGDLDSWNTVEGSFTVGAGTAGRRTTPGAVATPPRDVATPPRAVATPPRAVATTPTVGDDDTTAEVAETTDPADADDIVDDTETVAADDDTAAAEDDTSTEPAQDDETATSASRTAARANASLGAGSSSSGRGTTTTGAGSRTAAPAPASSSGTTGGTSGPTGGGTTVAAGAPATPTSQAPQAMAAPARPNVTGRAPEDEGDAADEGDEQVAADDPTPDAAPDDAAPTVTAAAPASVASGPPRLVGTVSRGADGWAALVTTPDTPTPVTVRAGDLLGDWSVESVQGRSVSLRSGDRVLVLELFGAAPGAGRPAAAGG